MTAARPVLLRRYPRGREARPIICKCPCGSQLNPIRLGGAVVANFSRTCWDCGLIIDVQLRLDGWDYFTDRRGAQPRYVVEKAEIKGRAFNG